MFETPLTVVGRIIAETYRGAAGSPSQEVISFRVASNSRRRDADGNWEAGNTLSTSPSTAGASSSPASVRPWARERR